MGGQVGILLQVMLFGSVKTMKAGFLDQWIFLDKMQPPYWCSELVTIVAFTKSQVISGSITILELVVGHM